MRYAVKNAPKKNWIRHGNELGRQRRKVDMWPLGVRPVGGGLRPWKLGTSGAEIAKMKVAEIDLQIRWHRAFDPLVPRAKDMPTKKEGKLFTLQQAVERYIDGSATQNGAQTEACDDGGSGSGITDLSPLAGAE
ncbi:hypothetical protein BDN67DRAFT_985797 [Paxillus ammoniavirescens]|nr:hypothetical protein BDN67DRAFT_985797 [Paxillus ammoniavirescens]